MHVDYRGDLCLLFLSSVLVHVYGTGSIFTRGQEHVRRVYARIRTRTFGAGGVYCCVTGPYEKAPFFAGAVCISPRF